MKQRRSHNLGLTPALAILASLAGLLLTHGIVIACLIYCALIHPADALVCHHHHGFAAHADSRSAAAEWQPAGAPAPVLERGSELPLAVAALLGALIVVRARRRIIATPAIRWASWIMPLAAPPPRMTGGR
jgi:hypothetical protein